MANYCHNFTDFHSDNERIIKGKTARTSSSTMDTGGIVTIII